MSATQSHCSNWRFFCSGDISGFDLLWLCLRENNEGKLQRLPCTYFSPYLMQMLQYTRMDSDIPQRRKSRRDGRWKVHVRKCGSSLFEQKRMSVEQNVIFSHLSNAASLLLGKREPYTAAHIRTDLVSICVLPPVVLPPVGSEREGEGVQSLGTQRSYGPHYESHGLRNDITSLQECLTQYVVMSAANFTRIRCPDTRSEQTEWHEVRGGGVKSVTQAEEGGAKMCTCIS